jgi:hypothetical protein
MRFKTLKHAACVHAETLDRRDALWDELLQVVATQIDVARDQGKMIVRINMPGYTVDQDRLMRVLKDLGYTATYSSDCGLMVGWRVPTGCATVVPMKRFLLFAYDDYYARGGMHDLVASFDTAAECMNKYHSPGQCRDRFQIVDSETWTVVESNDTFPAIAP